MTQHAMLFALLAAILLACGQATMVSKPHFTGNYYGGVFDYAAAGRDLHTVVVGNPFGGDDAAFAQRVTDILAARNPRQRTNFTIIPGPNARTQYKLVVYFDPARAVTPNVLCRDPQALQSAPDAARVSVRMAFCNGDLAISYLNGHYAGTDDALLADLLGTMLYQLLPIDTPRRLRGASFGFLFVS